MASNKNSIANTLTVAIVLCLVCATVVCSAAVGLRKLQTRNKLLDRQANILAAAGLMEEGTNVAETFEQRIEDHVIDLNTGDDVTDQVIEEFGSVADYDSIELAESNNEEYSEPLVEDPATIKRRENWAHVYIVKTSAENAKPIMYVFPIRGKGLWSILKGFIALDAKDMDTINGITYYAHQETPGLGGEVDNPVWKSHWVGKKLFQDGSVAIRLVKSPEWKNNPHEVDALSGATITCRGVERMLDFWMGEQGFEKYIDKIKTEDASAQASIN